jgi:hypothetical protein
MKEIKLSQIQIGDIIKGWFGRFSAPSRTCDFFFADDTIVQSSMTFTQRYQQRQVTVCDLGFKDNSLFYINSIELGRISVWPMGDNALVELLKRS